QGDGEGGVRDEGWRSGEEVSYQLPVAGYPGNWQPATGNYLPSPNDTPRLLAVITICPSGSTYFGFDTASLIFTSTISSPRRATIFPNFFWPIRSAAALPKRLARMRSKAIGEPPRWMCPRTVTRISWLICRPMSSATW